MGLHSHITDAACQSAHRAIGRQVQLDKRHLQPNKAKNLIKFLVLSRSVEHSEAMSRAGQQLLELQCLFSLSIVTGDQLALPDEAGNHFEMKILRE